MGEARISAKMDHMSHSAVRWQKNKSFQGFHITAMARGGRQPVVQACRELILKNQGHILDFKIESDLTLDMMVELHAYDSLQLVKDFNELGWKVEVLPGSGELEACGDDLLEGTIQVCFPEAHGDLKLPPQGMA